MSGIYFIDVGNHCIHLLLLFFFFLRIPEVSRILYLMCLKVIAFQLVFIIEKSYRYLQLTPPPNYCITKQK